MKVFKAPEKFYTRKGKTIFLAGSIEMGQAEKWQDVVINQLSDLDIDILNPRRDDWDSSWVQEMENLEFNNQVGWELQAMEMSDLILMYFSPGTISPITLLEFGLYARSQKLVVCCPEGFHRKGNVDIVCREYQIIQASSLDKMIEGTRRLFENECQTT